MNPLQQGTISFIYTLLDSQKSNIIVQIFRRHRTYKIYVFLYLLWNQNTFKRRYSLT